MILTRKKVNSKLGNRLILWINPQRIRFDVGTKWPVTIRLRNSVGRMPKIPILSRLMMRSIHYFEPFVIPPIFYKEARPVEALQKFRKVQDFLDNRRDIRTTIWYRQLSTDLRELGVAYHKNIRMRTQEDIDLFFDGYVAKMVESLIFDGYRMDKGGGLGSVLVGPDGELHKAGSGNHRFYIARILGFSQFPVHVAAVHSTWLNARFDAQDGSRLERLGACIAEVESAHQ